MRRILFARRSSLHVKSGEYFAPIGQIGEQVSLRQHCASPRYATEFLADGCLPIVIPAFAAHALSNARLYVSGNAGIGNGLARGSSSGGPCSPATPNAGVA